MQERSGSRSVRGHGRGRARLLGTSALAGAGAALAGWHPAAAQVKGIELGIGGFANEFLFVTNIDEDDADTRDFNEIATHFDGEVQFSGKAELDNGLTFGFQAELEVPTVGDQIDEVFMTIEGAFGKLVLGGDNSASYVMGLGLWDPYVGVPINSGWVSDFAPPPPGMTIAFRSPSVSTAIDITNDDNTFKYFTPRIAGFQFGVSYTPNASFSGNPTNGSVDTAGLTYSNGWSVAANFIQSFNGFDIGVSGGYARAQAGDAIEALGGDDIQQVMAGGYIAVSGFKVAGSYANEIDGRLNSTGTVSTEGDSYLIGASYSADPWTVGVAYFTGRVEGNPAISADDEQDAFSIGVQYQVGPGIAAAANLLYAAYDTEEGEDSDAFAGAVGFSLSF